MSRGDHHNISMYISTFLVKINNPTGFFLLLSFGSAIIDLFLMFFWVFSWLNYESLKVKVSNPPFKSLRREFGCDTLSSFGTVSPRRLSSSSSSSNIFDLPSLPSPPSFTKPSPPPPPPTLSRINPRFLFDLPRCKSVVLWDSETFLSLLWSSCWVISKNSIECYCQLLMSIQDLEMSWSVCGRERSWLFWISSVTCVCCIVISFEELYLRMFCNRHDTYVNKRVWDVVECFVLLSWACLMILQCSELRSRFKTEKVNRNLLFASLQGWIVYFYVLCTFSFSGVLYLPMFVLFFLN